MPIRLTLLGTGSSSAVPDISCVTAQNGRGCETCRLAVQNPGGPNMRANTGAILRVPQSDGTEKTILIDAGKTFREQAIKLFPKLGLRKIDACLITPSGGGAIPSFDWQTLTEGKESWICNVRVLPVPVHHGVYFSDKSTPLISFGFLFNTEALYMSDVSFIPESSWQLLAKYVDLPPARAGANHNATSSATAFHGCGAPLLEFASSPSWVSAVTKPRLLALIIDCAGLKLYKSHFGLPQTIATSRRLGSPKTYFTNLGHGTSHECWLYFCQQYERGRQVKQTNEIPWFSSSSNKTSSIWAQWPESTEQRSHAEIYRGFNPIVEDHDVFCERALVAIEEWDGKQLRKDTRPWCRPARDGMTLTWNEGEGLQARDRLGWDDEYHH
ncbi:hypothetical protein OIO90_006477 [Microbotryomycetes sp. JL221]|nr:hypothetical protein OIO90_006477 [Microbotryomycetes sp. JL221]